MTRLNRKIPQEIHRFDEVENFSYIEKETCEISAQIQRLSSSTKGALYQAHSKKQKVRALRGAVLFSGGPAPGGHMVVHSLWKAIERCGGSLFGYSKGFDGLLSGEGREITSEVIEPFSYKGGFHLLGTSRTKIETEEQFSTALKELTRNKIEVLFVVGGDDSNTNGALLAYYVKEKGSKCQVIGIPKTIDGDLRCPVVDISFGFDTAASVYSEIIGNIGVDARSSRKYYHYIKLMGRSASHVTMECAFRTHPNLAFISEEVREKKQTLQDIVGEIVELTIQRRKEGKEFGVILIPEGILESMWDTKELLQEISNSLAKGISEEEIEKHLSEESKKTYQLIPEKIQRQLIGLRDAHGNIAVSQIDAEVLLKELVLAAFAQQEKKPPAIVSHFLGYEGRCADPTDFDLVYCCYLGKAAYIAAISDLSGVLVGVSNLCQNPEDWSLEAITLSALFHIEERKGKAAFVIQKALVDLKSTIFSRFESDRKKWRLSEEYQSPGAIQYGEDRVTIPIILQQ